MDTEDGAPPGLLNVVVDALALAFVLLWLGIVTSTSGALMYPVTWLPTDRRLRLVNRWGRVHAWVALTALKLGGARYERRGSIDTSQPGIILMNHQSVLDIPTVVLMCGPLVPGFVARDRYARVPGISTGLALADCTVIDPQNDKAGAVLAMQRAIRTDRTMLVYPEGHRTLTGDLQPFRTSGLLAMLGERRVPVWLVVTDGFWKGRRTIDIVGRLRRIRGVTEILGPFEPPEDEAALPAFLEELHARMAAHIEVMRAARRQASAG